MKIAAAEAIASVIPPEELSADYIVPSVFNGEVAQRVAAAVAEVSNPALV
jgi:malate dehydrogenase (oxaloacetate-decarboxylating)